MYIKWGWAKYFIFYSFAHGRFYSLIIPRSNSNIKTVTWYYFLLLLYFFHTTTPVFSDSIQSLMRTPTQLKNVLPLDHFQDCCGIFLRNRFVSLANISHTFQTSEFTIFYLQVISNILFSGTSKNNVTNFSIVFYRIGGMPFMLYFLPKCYFTLFL